MQNNLFTPDEINLMCIYDTGRRMGLLFELYDVASYLSEEDKELAALIHSTIEKLCNMTDAEYDLLELYPDFC